MQEAEEPTPDPLPESDTDNDKYSDFVRVPGGGMCNITFDEVRTSSCSTVLVLLAHAFLTNTHAHALIERDGESDAVCVCVKTLPWRACVLVNTRTHLDARTEFSSMTAQEAGRAHASRAISASSAKYRTRPSCWTRDSSRRAHIEWQKHIGRPLATIPLPSL